MLHKKHLYRHSFYLLFIILLIIFNSTGMVSAATSTASQNQDIGCCSSVIFIPGFQASRLKGSGSPYYPDGHLRNFWEPWTNNDVRSIYLDEDGKSIDPTVLPNGVMVTAYGLKSLYSKVWNSIGNLVETGKINEWFPVYYDWRMSLDDIISTSTYDYLGQNKINLQQVVEKMALQSKTGKVSIVTHSNGGLVAKMLVHELEKQGKAHLIDKVILVAVPQFGTPQAAAALLHGSGQQLLGGLIMTNYVARELGHNMLGAYGLLPTSEYFLKIAQPVLTFAGKALGDYSAFTDFLTGISPTRARPKIKDVKTPEVLSDKLLLRMREIHKVLDTWSFPTSTQVVALAGWGVPTPTTIAYSSSSPVVLKESNGDGTVITESALGYVSEKLYFNEGLYNHELDQKNTHLDIMETEPVNQYIEQALLSITLPTTNLPTYLSTKKPSTNYPWMQWLTISVHSPVDVELSDSKGRSMSLSALDYEEDGLYWMNNAVGGQYETIGDEKYITVPADETYTVKLKGTDVGTFTLQIQKFSGESMTEVKNITYTDLPVTPLLEASTTINGLSLGSELNLDVDGDGVTDITAQPSDEISPHIHSEAMKKILTSLKLPKNVEKQLLQKIKKLEKLEAKGSQAKLFKELVKITKKISKTHWKINKISQTEKEALIAMFEEVMDKIK